MKNIIFYGGASMLSYIWSDYWKNKFNIYLAHNKRWVNIKGTQSFQLTKNESQLKDFIGKHNIDTLINCAGLTNVEECEKNSKIAFELNSILPGKLAKITNELGVKFIQISTDHLDDGKKKMNSEISIPNPINIYAKSKLEGENNVIVNNQKALVIRTNFFGNGPLYKPSFSDNIIYSLKKNEKIFLFNNVYYTPIHVAEMADNIYNLLNLNVSGIFNISSNERITKYEFGLMIARKLNLDTNLIYPIKIEEKAELVERPRDMSLSNLKLKKFTKLDVNSLSTQLDYLL